MTATKFPESKQELAKAIYNEIISDPYKRALLEANGIKEDKFKEILEIIETSPAIVVIINELTKKINEAVNLLSNALKFNVRAIEFKTFRRENSHSLNDHIHVFEIITQRSGLPEDHKTKPKSSHILKGKKIILKMIEEGYLYPGFKIHGEYRGELYEAEILEDGRIRIINDGSIHTSLSKAAFHITKKGTNGWYWWKYKDEEGREHEIDELRQKYFQHESKLI
jgi:hypothetical protein